MVKIPTNRKPTHPGEILRHDFLDPMGISQTQTAKDIGIDYQRLNEIVNGKRRVSHSTALRLAKYLETTPSFWLNLQNACDLYETQINEAKTLSKIKPAQTNAA